MPIDQTLNYKKQTKKLQQTVSELQSQIEEEQKSRAEAREAAVAAERRANQLLIEIDDSRVAVEQAEKSRKAIELELHAAADHANELSASSSALNGLKRKLESDITALRAEVEETRAELRNSEQRVKTAANDAVRISEELRAEQERSSNIEKLRKALEQQIVDLNARLERADSSASAGGRRAIQKLEQRISELEAERDAESRSTQEALKEVRKNDRRLKELTFQAEEDKKNQSRLQDLIDKLQTKLTVYKKQIEDAEEIAAINLSKYRKAQHELEDATQRADQAESQIAKNRALNRSSTSIDRETASSAVPLRAGSLRR